MQEGKRIRTTFLEVRAIASPHVCSAGTSCTRVGLIVPRFRQSAVARNSIKRRLRELTRTTILPSKLAAAVVIRIRPEAYKARFEQLASDIDRALAQVAHWREGQPEPTPEAPNALSDGLPTDA
jgi:ribonuclease P protein component